MQYKVIKEWPGGPFIDDIGEVKGGFFHWTGDLSSYSNAINGDQVEEFLAPIKAFKEGDEFELYIHGSERSVFEGLVEDGYSEADVEKLNLKYFLTEVKVLCKIKKGELVLVKLLKG